jgi:CheY-like chemotaxis protein
MEPNQKIKVLLVDDDQNVRNVLRDAIQAYGFEVYDAADGQSGLAKAFEVHPDVIMLDIMMPNMDGWQVLNTLRQDPWGKNAQVIMLTALGEMDNVAAAVDQKAFAYIVKSDLHISKIPELIMSAVKNRPA